MPILTEERFDEILTGWEGPFKYEPNGTCVLDSKNNQVCDIRSWGRLKYQGHQYATRLQDSMGHLIASLLNQYFYADNEDY